MPASSRWVGADGRTYRPAEPRRRVTQLGTAERLPLSRPQTRRGEAMGLEVKVLDLGDIELDASFLVLGHNMGQRLEEPTFGFLITGGETPIVVDTGFSHPEIMGNLGMKGWYRGDQGMEKQL